MRNYSYFNRYLDSLIADTYAQPEDVGHTDFAKLFLEWALPIVGGRTVLDVGCGQGFCRPLFEKSGYEWHGVTVGEDYTYCHTHGIVQVDNMDMSFLSYPDQSYDLVFARHVLEHSPFPILTLMEWRRVCKQHLLIVLPTPEYWGFGGRNHYSVYTKEQWWNAFGRAGWKVIHENSFNTRHATFMKHFLPDVEDRTQAVFPGPAKDVEFWYILEKAEEKID